MSNVFGNEALKIEFDWSGETKTINLESKRIEASYELNKEIIRVHKSELNGVIIKEHLGYYHSIKVHFHDISCDDYCNTFKYLSIVDYIKVYPFRDNTTFYFTAIIDKNNAYPYEFDDISKLPMSYFLECDSDNYKEMAILPKFIGCLRMKEIQLPLEPFEGAMLRMEEIVISPRHIEPIDGYITRYLCNETSGTVITDEAGNNDGTLSVDASTCTTTDFDGNDNEAFTMTGTQYIETDIGKPVDKTIYIEFTHSGILPDPDPEFTTLIYQGDSPTSNVGDAIIVDSTARIATTNNGFIASGGERLVSGKNRIVATFTNNGVCKLWLNGHFAAQGTTTTRENSGTNHYIGKASDFYNIIFTSVDGNLYGKVSDVVFYDSIIDDESALQMSSIKESL